jgi:uncharacterized paraquat-inducible protein A
MERRRRSARLERTLSSAMEKRLLRLCALAAMYLLASPVLLVQWIGKVRKEIAAIRRIRTGIMGCPYCSFENPLNRMATCGRCRATEPSSVLRCSFCKATFKTITCDRCAATLRVV